MASLINGLLPSSMVQGDSTLRVWRKHRVSSRCCASLSSEKSPGELAVAALQPYVNDVGKPILAILEASLRDQERALRDQERALRDREIAWERAWVAAAKVESSLKEDVARAQVALMKAQGLGNTRGLFEFLKQKLKEQLNIPYRLKGAPLWELFLKENPELASCIERSTGVTTSHVHKQAMVCYNVYSSLSEHIHEGKNFAEIEAAARGAIIKFDKGPLSSVQVKILVCIGEAAGVPVEALVS